MTAIASSRVIPTSVGGLIAVAVVAIGSGARPALAADAVLSMRAKVIGAATETALTIDLFRWSTDEERKPLLEAMAPLPPPEPDAADDGREGRGARGGRGGRGRGRGAAPPPTMAERLEAAVEAAPTVGFIWGDGPTGYSVRYAWRADAPGGGERIVLAIYRRLGAHSVAWPAVPEVAADADADFTVIEMRLDGEGAGVGKTSLAAGVALEAGRTLALDAYDAAPVLLEVTR